MKSKLPQIAIVWACSMIAFAIWGCAPSSIEPESVDSNQLVTPFSDGQNAGMHVDLLTSEQIASFSGSFFVPEGEDQFKELVQTPIYRMVEMYQGESVDRSAHPEYLYDGVGKLGKEEGLTEREFLSLLQGVNADILALDRSVNSQIMVTDEECKVYQVDFWRYWSGNLFEYNGHYNEMGGIEADGIDDIYSSEEGYFSENVLGGILSDAGITEEVYAEEIAGTVTYPEGGTSHIDTVPVWSAEEKTSLSVGRYEETSWKEGIIHFETPYYVVFPEPVLAPTPTKLRYFICDFSSIDPGLYILMNGEGVSGQLIEVV